MQIRKGEHSIWFVRYHENDLEVEERLMVDTFLILHPELQAEFDQLADVKLSPQNHQGAWNELKKPEIPNEREAQDLFLARALEEDISQSELQSLMLSVQHNASLRKDWETMQLCRLQTSTEKFDKSSLYCSYEIGIPEFLLQREERSAIRLQADSSIIFSEKAKLKKVPVRPMKQGSVVKLWSYAAAVAAVLIFALLFNFDENRSGNTINIAQAGVLKRQGNLKTSGTDDAVIVTERLPLKPLPLPEEETERLAEVEVFNGSIDKMDTRGISKINVHIAANPALQLPSDEVVLMAEANSATIATKADQGYLSLTDFAKMQLNKSLTGEENPESGLVYATLDQAAKKISEKSGKTVEFKLPENKGNNKDFNIRIGKFGVSRTSSTNQP